MMEFTSLNINLLEQSVVRRPFYITIREGHQRRITVEIGYLDFVVAGGLMPINRILPLNIFYIFLMRNHIKLTM